MSGTYVIWPPTPSGGTGGGSGVTTIGSMDSQVDSANGATIVGTTLYMQSASSATAGAGVGLVNTVAQPFLGTKTFVNAPIFASLSPNAQISTNASGQVVASSVSLTSQVTGVLPLGNTSVIPVQPGGQTSGSISLTSQVSGSLPLSNMNLSIGSTDAATATSFGATLGSNSLYLQSATGSQSGIVNLNPAGQAMGAGPKIFPGQIFAQGGIGLTTTTLASGSLFSQLSIGCDGITQTIVLGSTSVSGGQYYPRIGIAMNNPQASIHWGGNAGNSNSTTGTVGSFSIVLGTMNTSNNLGLGAVIIGGNTAGALTASGQGSVAIGDASTRATASFAVAIGDGAVSQSVGGVAIGTGATTNTTNNNCVAIGNSANAIGLDSVAVGNGVVSNITGQTAVGSFNIVSTGNGGAVGTTDEVFVVGIGQSNTVRQNVLSCTRDGGTRFYTSSGSSYVALYTGTTTSYALTWPGSLGTNGQALTVGSGGAMSWSSVGGIATAGSVSLTSSTGGSSYTMTMPGSVPAIGQILVNNTGGVAQLGWITPPTNIFNSGYFSNSSGAAGYTVTSQTFADFTLSSGAAYTYVTRYGAGGLAITICSNSNIPGITFTPSVSSSYYYVKVSTTMAAGALAAYGSLSLTDGTNQITTAFCQSTSASQPNYPVTLEGVYATSSNTASQVTIKIQGACSSATLFLSGLGGSGISPAKAFEWTIFRIL